jgi:hypothetical protein
MLFAFFAAKMGTLFDQKRENVKKRETVKVFTETERKSGMHTNYCQTRAYAPRARCAEKIYENLRNPARGRRTLLMQ